MAEEVGRVVGPTLVVELKDDTVAEALVGTVVDGREQADRIAPLLRGRRRLADHRLLRRQGEWRQREGQARQTRQKTAHDPSVVGETLAELPPV
jgi:hypothetical protein